MMQLFLLAIFYFCHFLRIAIFTRAIISWVRLSRENVIVNFVFVITEPVLKPIRDLLNKSPLGGESNPVDFSPIIALMLMSFVVLPILTSMLQSMA